MWTMASVPARVDNGPGAAPLRARRRLRRIMVIGMSAGRSVLFLETPTMHIGQIRQQTTRFCQNVVVDLGWCRIPSHENSKDICYMSKDI